MRSAAPPRSHSIVHGTTVGTNTLLERRGPKIGVITTRGFRDVLEMRRRDRRRTWGLWGDFIPIADRDMRVEVNERTLADGSIRTPVDPAEVRAAAKYLLDKGAASIAITFINAYANADNERGASAPCARSGPTTSSPLRTRCCPKSASSNAPRPTAINAYLQPVVASYIGKLESALKAQGFPGQLHIVQSNGGIMSTATARKLPARTALSGPAAGVVAGAAIAKASGFDNLITCDLGGTSFDVSVIAGGKVSVAAQTTIDFGLVIRTPMIEITTIGAGGGSIASVDRGGLLQVGPESAGSVPGPVCYGQGNTRPTLTDAQVVLGRINAARPLGGELKSLDVEAAKRAIAAHVGAPLGLDATAAAAAIVQVADARMAGAIRLVSIERGHDPARFVAMPFGGGGALHVSALIREIGLKCALVPRFPGITSALGCVLADLRHDMVQTLNVMLEWPRRRGARTADARRRPGGQRRHRRLGHRGRADRRAVRAGHALSRADPHRCRAAARGAARQQPRRVREHGPLRLRSRLSGVVQPPAARPRDANRVAARGGDRPPSGVRLLGVRARSVRVAREGAARIAAGLVRRRLARHRVWARLDLPVDAKIAGPAILEQPDATTVIEPGLAGRIDALGNLIVEPA